MSQLPGGSIHRNRPRPNVYSVLAIIATLVLAVGVGYLWTKNLELTRVPASEGGQHTGMNPFYIMGQK